MIVRAYEDRDISAMVSIWNGVVEEGIAFPQEEFLDEETGKAFFAEQLVTDCLKQAKKLGFRVMQFNAVVESNIHARHLYERLGFKQLGTIPGGFRMKDGSYVNICPYYHEL